MKTQQLSRGALGLAAFGNPEMNFQLTRSLGAIAYGGGALGEILQARADISDGDPVSWVEAFSALASATEMSSAARAVPVGRIRQGEALLRSSMYWRAAEYYASPAHAASPGLRSRIAFRTGMDLLGRCCETVTVQFGSELLNGYLLLPAATAAPRPLLVVMSGFDGTAEELYFEIGAAAVARGWACLLMEGPGQTGTRRDNPGSVFRPDYAPVVSAFLDAVHDRPAIDMTRTALYGISFGGYFASRAIADGAPCQALIANSPILDLQAYMTAFIGPDLCAAPPDVTVDEIDEIPDTVLPPLMKHGLRMSCLRFGTESFAGFLRRLVAFQIPNPAAIRCPTLALYGEGEGEEVERQARTFATQVKGPTTLHCFRGADGAGDHCQFGNLALSAGVVLDWLTTLWEC